MGLKLIDGKSLAKETRENIKNKVETLKQQGITPGLAVVLVGDDAASQIYVNGKEKACQEVGFYSEIHRLSEETTQEQLLNLVEQLNQDGKIHGILVQLPLPNHLDEKLVINTISKDKDVDGFHLLSAGALMVGEKSFQPCTPKGCMELIRTTGIDLNGKKAVIVGRSNIVGKPIAMMLLQANATVTICHSKTQNLKSELLQADVVVAAVGVANLIKGDMIKPGAIVIDVGMNRLENGKLAGDVDRASLEGVDCWLTPVPGGVGPMTITMLMANTLEAAENQLLL